MSESKPSQERRDQRIVRHIKALAAALGQEEAYQQALNGVRDDNGLTEAQREAIYKTLAQQSLLWYIEACSGKPVNFSELSAKLHSPSAS